MQLSYNVLTIGPFILRSVALLSLPLPLVLTYRWTVVLS